jgi:23S rRNA pseudouridine1911/1915/1917 synthase
MSGEPTGDAVANLKIILLDNQILVAVKPPGILSQSDKSGRPDMLTLLKDELKIRFNKPGQVYLGLVHRLDQPVGGIMVFARTSKSAARLSAQIREHKLAKYYLAVVEGRPESPAGRLTDQILKEREVNTARIVADGEGRSAWLDYHMLQYRADKNLSLLAIRLGTGRSHQIRLQLASRNLPIYGDHRYNPRAAGRQNPALFACCLGFFHPVRKEWLTVAADMPAEYPWSNFWIVDTQTIPQHFMV